MSYRAGDLELQLTAISDKALQSLNRVNVALSYLSTNVRGLTTTDLKWFNSFGTKMKNLSKKFNDIDWKNVRTGFDNLTTAITPFIDKVASANSALKSLDQVLTKVSGAKINKLTNLTSPKANNGLLGVMNLRRIFNIAFFYRVGRLMGRIVQYGVDFTETLNLWQVAMRNNLAQADEFIKKMNKAYGISQQTLMNAQATFKNMIGSLGNISDTVAYQLSESILQMATDFSSLYNVTFENAITKFQAALAGQVRPIRSGSGYDITENTLYQVYQQLGGTKTQRQLNRTEKQLLAIYTVFQQMQRSGAVGDLSKTLNNFANQSRMMSENFKELATYTGLFFQDLLQSWGVLRFINAGIIFLTEIVKGLTNYQAPNFLDGMFESVTDTSEAIDELQGKLLDFDKFRALDGGIGDDSALSIDEKLLNALTSYQSILENVNNEARDLATKWLKNINILIPDINGELVFNEQKLNDIKSTLIAVVSAFGFLIGGNLILGLVGLTKKIIALSGATSVLNIAIGSIVVFSLVKLIYAIKDGNTTAQVLYGTIMALAVIAFVALNKQMLITIGTNIAKFFSGIATVLKVKLVPSLTATTTSFTLLHAAISIASFALGYLISDKLLGTLDGTAKKVASITLAVVGLATALVALKAVISGGLSLTKLAVIGTGVGIFAGGLKNTIESFSVPKYATGASNIDSGTMFIAGEAGKTEAVYTGSNGKANVANISQMREADYQGTTQALNDWWSSAKYDIPRFNSVSPTGLYEVVDGEAKRRGQGFAKR